jgi:hypothetical protein
LYNCIFLSFTPLFRAFPGASPWLHVLQLRLEVRFLPLHPAIQNKFNKLVRSAVLIVTGIFFYLQPEKASVCKYGVAVYRAVARAIIGCIFIYYSA